MQHDADRVLGSERDEWLDLHRLVLRNQREALGDHGERDLRLHHREVVPETLPGPPTKGEVRVLRHSLEARRQEAVWIESLRVGPHIGVAMRVEGADQYYGAGRDVEAREPIWRVG